MLKPVRGRGFCNLQESLAQKEPVRRPAHFIHFFRTASVSSQLSAYS